MSEEDPYELYLDKVFRIVENPLRFPKDMSKVLDHLYIGTYGDAVEVDQLKRAGITHIINCVEDTRQYKHAYKTGAEFYGEEFKYLGFMSQDDESYPILVHFEDVYSFIEDARESNGKCLIHCMAGVNRSAALCVAYLMVHQSMGAISAVETVLNARGMILTNAGFVKQLVKFGSDRDLLTKDMHRIQNDT